MNLESTTGPSAAAASAGCCFFSFLSFLSFFSFLCFFLRPGQEAMRQRGSGC